MGNINFIRTYINKHNLIHLPKYAAVTIAKTFLQKKIVHSRKEAGMLTV